MIIKQEVITSRNNPAVKYAASLKEKKYRDAEGAFFVEGEKLCLEAIKSGLPVTRVYVCETKCKEMITKIQEVASETALSDCQMFILAESAFEKISTENSPQGIICVIKYLDFFNYSDIIYKEDFLLSEGEKALILCSVRDPGNLGAVIRSAAAFGVDRIYLSSDCADVYNSKTVRGAMGSLFKIKITTVGDMPSLVAAMQGVGRRVFSAELRPGALSLSDVALRASDVFIIGNEGHGIPEQISSCCDSSVFIPISANTESLNASVAAAVIMWEICKFN